MSSSLFREEEYLSKFEKDSLIIDKALLLEKGTSFYADKVCTIYRKNLF
jgi:hypothetical protein